MLRERWAVFALGAHVRPELEPLFVGSDNPYVYASNNPLSNVDPCVQRSAGGAGSRQFSCTGLRKVLISWRCAVSVDDVYAFLSVLFPVGLTISFAILLVITARGHVSDRDQLASGLFAREQSASSRVAVLHDRAMAHAKRHILVAVTISVVLVFVSVLILITTGEVAWGAVTFVATIMIFASVFLGWSAIAALYTYARFLGLRKRIIGES